MFVSPMESPKPESLNLGIDDAKVAEVGSAMFVSPMESPKPELLNLGTDANIRAELGSDIMGLKESSKQELVDVESDEEILIDLGSLLFDKRGLVSPIESSKCRYEIGQQIAQAFEDFLEEGEEIAAAFKNYKCAGILDRDAINPGDLSPMFKLVVIDDDFVVEKVGEVDFEQNSKWSHDKSPLKVLAKKWDSHAVFFRATYRIQGIGEHGAEQYGTCFALCKQCIGSCKHLCFTEARTRILAWRAIHGTCVESSLFQNSQCPRCHMQLLDVDDESHVDVMRDPITGGIYDISDFAYVDACVWALSDKHHGFHVPRNLKLVKSFRKYLIPMSVTMELLYETVQELGCCMVHYPMVEKIRVELKADFPDNTLESEMKQLLKKRIQLFTSNCHVLGDKIEATLQGGTLKEFYREDAMVAKQHVKAWFDEMREKILNFTEKKKPGEFILGTGKVLAFNKSLIAHSISAFPGSSGSAVVLVDGEPGCFIGIHLSPACLPIDAEGMWSILPDHNLACNTENELYGKMYFKKVLPLLDLEHVDARRKKVLYRFLAYHLESILKDFKIDSWLEIQKTWVNKTISYLVDFLPLRCKQNLEDVFDSYRLQDADVRMWYQKWGKAIQDAGPDCILALRAEKFVQECALL